MNYKKYSVGIFFSLFIMIALYLNSRSASGLIVAVLMVKNEAAVMQKTLQPLLDAGIKDYFIYDTGSTDNTIAVAQELLQAHNISRYVIVQEDWIDFSASRNRALRLAEEKFHSSVFMLMLDADWILHNGEGLIDYCLKHQHTTENLFAIKVKDGTIDFYHARLMRIGAGITFAGRVHEVPAQRSQARVPSSIYFQYAPNQEGRKKSKERWKKDAIILLEDVAKNPDDAHQVFMLAQTYADLDDYDQAIYWYNKRTTMNDPEKNGKTDEELFLAYFILAILYEKIDDEKQMFASYKKAFSLRPHRAEPLIKMAQYYYKKNDFEKSFNLIKQSLDIAYPEQEFLYIFERMYQYTRYSLASSMAHMFGQYHLGLQATLQAIEHCKNQQDYVALQNNALLYKSYLQLNSH